MKDWRIEVGGGSEEFAFHDVLINYDNEVFCVLLYNYYSFNQRISFICMGTVVMPNGDFSTGGGKISLKRETEIP